jgi:uncharacterized membrane protein
MATTLAMSNSTRSDWLVPAGLIALSLVPTIFGTVRLAQLASGAAITMENARFFAAPLPVMAHILAVIPYCIVGAFQFAPAFRRRHRRWHRASGRMLAPLGLIAAVSGLWMTLTYPWPAGDGEGVYVLRLLFGSAMAAAILLGLNEIRRRDYAAHGAWMMRGYAIGLGAGTQVLTHLPWFVLFGKPGESARTLLMGAGWVINVAIAEWIIRKQRARHGTLHHAPSKGTMNTSLKYLVAVTACTLAATTATAQSAKDVRGSTPLVALENEAPARLIVDPPLAGALAVGAVLIQYRTENLRVLPVFGKAALGVSPRVGHLHVTVDNAPWHFVDTSGETVILVGLEPGAHSVLFELADAAHRVLTSETIKFTLPAVVAAKAH